MLNGQNIGEYRNFGKLECMAGAWRLNEVEHSFNAILHDFCLEPEKAWHNGFRWYHGVNYHFLNGFVFLIQNNTTINNFLFVEETQISLPCNQTIRNQNISIRYKIRSIHP